LLLPSAAALAADPILPDLSDFYEDVELIAKARLAGSTPLLDADALRFLSEDAPLDQKIALISALDPEAEPERAVTWLRELARLRGIRASTLPPRDLTPSWLVVAALLLSLEDEGAPGGNPSPPPEYRGSTPLELMSRAALALPDDFEVHLLHALLQARSNSSDGPCAQVLALERVLASFSEEARRLRPEAVDTLLAPLAPRRDACARGVASGGEAPQLGAPGLTRIHALGGYRGWIAGATEDGAFLYKPGKVLFAESETPCPELRVAGDLLWVGCESSLLRFDGDTWEIALSNPDRPEVFSVVVMEDGDIVALQGDRAYKYQPRKGVFTADPELFGLGADDVLVRRRDGSHWRLFAERGLSTGSRLIPVLSPFYPGPDPRRFYESRRGDLWVVDGVEGFFRYDDRASRFTRVEAVRGAGADVGVDEMRGRTWFLLERGGLLLHDGERLVASFDLSSLGEARDLYIDSRGEVWVGGSAGLLHVREEAGTWALEFPAAR
jgi:hypothetical protein